MATQVNKKIVAAIVVGIVGLCLAVVAAGVYFTQTAPEKNIGRGDAAFAAGDYKVAADQYSRAVNKEPTNVEYLDKWRDALVQVIPDTDADYEQSYAQYLNGILEQKARQRPGEGAFQTAFVDEFIRSMRARGASGANVMDQIVDKIEERAQGLRDDDPDRARVLRWRGWALSNKAGATPLTEEEYEQATSDLTQAYEIDSDALALIDMHALHNNVARRATADRQMQRAERASEAADAVYQKMIAEHEGHPSVIATRLLVERSNTLGMTPEAARAAVREAAETAADALAAIDVSQYDATTLVNTVRAMKRASPNSVNERLDSVLERKLEEEPANSFVMMLRAELALDVNDADGAFSTYQEIIDTENQPISIEGLRLLRDRRMALFAQGKLRVKQAEFAPRNEKAPFLDEAEELLATLRERVLSNEQVLSQQLQAMITLQRALLAENALEKQKMLNESLALLEQLENADPRFSRDPEILLGYVLALTEQQLPGAAREKLEELDALTGGAKTPQMLLYWAQIEQQLNNVDQALQYFVELDKLVPDNDFVIASIARLTAAVDGEAEGADPLLVAINRSRDLRAEGDMPGAVAVLESLLAEMPANPDVLRFLVSLDLSMENRDLAERRLRNALEIDPDNRTIRNLLTRVETEDPVEAQLAIIAESDQTELEQTLQREAVFRVARRTDDANNELAKAVGLDADDPTVIDRQFVRALARGDEGIADAEAAVERAARIDLDGHGGDIYRARLLVVKGESEEAIEILTAITEANSRDADAWRWLGGAQRSAGLIDAAVESYARAYNARPSDVGYAGDYANALVAAGRGVEAAAVLSPDTGLLSFGTGGDQMVERWLQLEGLYGNRARVKQMRSESFKRDASAIVNTLSYLQILIEDEEFDTAQEVIDTYAESRNPRALRVAQMTAALRARQDRFDDAVAVMNEYIASVPEAERTSEPYRILARLYEEQGDAVNAADTFRRGRDYQDERLLLDRSLADLRFRYASELRSGTMTMSPEDPNLASVVELYRAGYREAMDVYVEILDTTGFDELIAKRISECQLRLQMYEELDGTLDMIVEETGNENDLQVLLIRAVAAEQQGDRAELDRLMNRAVEFNRSNPLAFFRRAQVNSGIPDRLPDVIADLEQAVRLRPGYVEAWSLLAQTYARLGESEQAFQKLRGAIESNPNDERLPRVLVDLYVALGSFDNALDEAVRYANQDQTDEYWVNRAARLSQRVSDFDSAYRWLTIQDELQGYDNDAVALDRLNSLLRRDSGVDVPEVNRLMRRVDAMEHEGDAKIVVGLLRARAEAARGNNAASDRIMIEVHELARDRGSGALNLFVQSLFLRASQTMPPQRAQQAVLTFLRDTPGLQPLHPYLKLELVRPNVFAAETRDQQEQVNQVLESIGQEIDPADVQTRFRFLTLASNLRYTLGDYEGSVAASTEALELAPNNAEMANNLAYTLSTHLGRHEEALPYAQRAAQVQPNASYVLDTLGVVLMRTGDIDGALLTLDRAITTAVGPDALFAALLHKAEALLEADRVNEARQHAVRAQSQMNNSTPQTRELYEDDLQRLIERLP